MLSGANGGRQAFKPRRKHGKPHQRWETLARRRCPALLGFPLAGAAAKRQKWPLAPTSAPSIGGATLASRFRHRVESRKLTQNDKPPLPRTTANPPHPPLAPPSPQVTLFVAPCMTVIDKAIVESAAGTRTILSSSLSSLKSMSAKPLPYLKSPMFLMMWATYGLTYATANSVRTVSEEIRLTKEQGQTALFAGTTIVNSTATMFKDRAYATMFGQTATRSVPLVTYGLWGMRDCMVIGSSFVMPRVVAERLVEDFGVEEGAAWKVAQLSCPVITQAVAGPVQLLGLGERGCKRLRRPPSATSVLPNSAVASNVT